MPRFPTDEEMVKHLLSPETYSRVAALADLWSRDLADAGLPGCSIPHVLRSLAAKGVREELEPYVEAHRKKKAETPAPETD